jgi:hypothetical protein
VERLYTSAQVITAHGVVKRLAKVENKMNVEHIFAGLIFIPVLVTIWSVTILVVKWAWKEIMR